MLRALLHSKDLGTFIRDSGDSLSWRHIFKASEDFLTASVFSRLSYLDGVVVWQILRETFGQALPNCKVATLQNVEFWPRWSLPTRDFVEPDILFQFRLGDPEMLVDILVESKLGDGYGQNAPQWIAEIEAYREQFGGVEGRQLYFLAMGGLGPNYKRRTADLAVPTVEAVGQVNILGASWGKLNDVIHDLGQGSRNPSRILEDILEALALCGERKISELCTLRDMDRNWSLDDLKKLRRAMNELG